MSARYMVFVIRNVKIPKDLSNAHALKAFNSNLIEGLAKCKVRKTLGF